jgi:uncharacterized membrane protein YgcG
MPRINPEGQFTRAERLATVVAVAGAVLVHLVVILGWGRLSRWAQEEQKKERVMVIRRVRDIAPPSETPPERRQRLAPAPAGEEGAMQEKRKAAPPPPEPKVREQGPEPPKETELSPEMERDLSEQKPEEQPVKEQGDNSVSVVTDLPAASFLVAGAAQQFRGSGTYWVRKGAPPGVYTATFNPVAGFSTPPLQTKELARGGQIAFIGKYRRSTEITVESNMPGARVTVFRPDGRPIDLVCPGKVVLDDLPSGSYTAVFKDIPGHLTPAPVSKNLVSGGKLYFFGEYRKIPAGRDPGEGSAGEAAAGDASGPGGGGDGSGAGQGGSGAGRGGGTGSGRGSGRKTTAAAVPEEGGLDRRVQMVVKSYPPTRIERDFDPIPYPEVIIRRSNFQQGWCQVYLIVDIGEGGEVARISIERPHQESRAQFEALIRAVEAAVRSWKYDKIIAEVHVDVRFYVE